MAGKMIDLRLVQSRRESFGSKLETSRQLSHDTRRHNYLPLSLKVDKVPLLEQLVDKIQTKYGVIIEKDQRCCSTTGGGVADIQWIGISGDPSSCKSASAYVTALCNPADWTVFEYGVERNELFSDDKCDEIEDQSNAVLIKDGTSRLIIQGADQLSVILALSVVENTIAENMSTDHEISDASNISVCNSSMLLNDMLKSAYTDETENNLSTMPEEVKRAVLFSIHDQSRADDTSFQNGDDDDDEDDDDFLVELNTTCTSTPVSTKVRTSSVPSVAMLPSSSQSSAPASKPNLFDPAIQPLIRIARGKNYSMEEIEKVLNRGQEWKESEFLRCLHTNRRLQNVSIPTETAKKPYISATDKTPLQFSVADSSTCDDHLITTSAARNSSNNNNILDVESLRRLEVSDSQMDTNDPANSDLVTSPDGQEDSIIFLKSDNESAISDIEVMEADVDMCTPVNDKSVGEHAQKDVPTTKKAKKKKKKKSRSKPDNTAKSSDTPSSSIKTSSNVADLDCISLIPSSTTNDVIVIDDDSDSGGSSVVMISQTPSVPGASMVTKLSKKQRRKLRAAEENRSRSPCKPTSSTQHQPSTSILGTFQRPGPACSNFAVNSAPGNVRFPPPPVPLMRMTINNSALNQRQLRYIVIDGSNVAMSHGNGKIFSCRGIQLVIEFFKRRGHVKVVALVPQWRRQFPRATQPTSDQHLLEEMKDAGTLAFTPARRIGNQNYCCYDDRFMLDLAIQTQGVIVTNDNYRDLYNEKFQYRDVIEHRLLPYSFVDDIFMIPDDPLGQNGPHIDDFLRLPAPQQRANNRPPLNGYAPPPSTFPQPSRQFAMPPPMYPPPPYYPPRPQSMMHMIPGAPSLTNAPQMDRWRPPLGSQSASAKGAPVPDSAQSSRHDSKQVRSAAESKEIRKQLLDVFPSNESQINQVMRQDPFCFNADVLCLRVAKLVTS